MAMPNNFDALFSNCNFSAAPPSMTPAFEEPAYFNPSEPSSSSGGNPTQWYNPSEAASAANPHDAASAANPHDAASASNPSDDGDDDLAAAIALSLKTEKSDKKRREQNDDSGLETKERTDCPNTAALVETFNQKDLYMQFDEDLQDSRAMHEILRCLHDFATGDGSDLSTSVGDDRNFPYHEKIKTLAKKLVGRFSRLICEFICSKSGNLFMMKDDSTLPFRQHRLLLDTSSGVLNAPKIFGEPGLRGGPDWRAASDRVINKIINENDGKGVNIKVPLNRDLDFMFSSDLLLVGVSKSVMFLFALAGMFDGFGDSLSVENYLSMARFAFDLSKFDLSGSD
jgi:hypothetical protein